MVWAGMWALGSIWDSIGPLTASIMWNLIGGDRAGIGLMDILIGFMTIIAVQDGCMVFLIVPATSMWGTHVLPLVIMIFHGARDMRLGFNPHPVMSLMARGKESIVRLEKKDRLLLRSTETSLHRKGGIIEPLLLLGAPILLPVNGRRFRGVQGAKQKLGEFISRRHLIKDDRIK